MTDTMDWLEPKLKDVPESLRARIRSAVASGTASGSRHHAVLKEIAEQLMEEAKTAPPTHDTAMTLLTADALMTYAVEAVAETEPDRLAEMR